MRKRAVFKWKKIILESVWICMAAVGAALLINAVRPDGLPLFYKPSEPIVETMERSSAAQQGVEEAEISVETALRLFENQKALFVDARSSADYEAGHIQGAVNLPVLALNENFGAFFEKVDPEQPIVTYCSDSHCHLAPDLATELKNAGYQKVTCFAGGLKEWTENGYPVEP